MTVELEAGIVVRDEAALRAFYTDVMGFVLVDHLEHTAGAVWKLRRGDARLKLFKSRGAVEPFTRAEPWYRPGGWRYAALYVDRPDDVDELAALVAVAGGAVLIEPASHRPGARMALVADPEGNVWELLAEDLTGANANL